MWWFLGLVLGLAVCGVVVAEAMPKGRAWIPFTVMEFPHTTDYLGAALLDRTMQGLPSMQVDVRWDSSSSHRWTGFAWADSGWMPTLVSEAPHGFPLSFLVQDGPTRGLTWLAYRLGTLGAWMTVALDADHLPGMPDSVFETTTQSTEYGAAASSSRRWTIRCDNSPDIYVNHARVFYSDTLRSWHEVPRLGLDEDHCTIAPLGDTTAMVVYAGLSGLQYAILDGAQWRETGNLDPRPFNASHPRLRLRRSGGLWLFWADNDWMHMSTYRGGAWERGDSVQCIPVPGETFRPTFLDAEHDTTEYPLVAWTNSGYGDTWRDVTSIAFPNDHGWDAGEEIPDSEESGWIAPTMMRDLNSDVWVIWRRARSGINRWTHTYCTATCAAPSIMPNGSGTRVSWALSVPAKGSRWTVQRAQGDGPFDSLGTVRAGADSLLTFDDPSAGPGITWRYRIRRESVDTRFGWTSPLASHQRADTRQPIGIRLTSPTGASLSFRLTGGAGLVVARLYDLQGRVALEEQLPSSGTGDDAFTLDLGASGANRSGIYFLRVSDSTGRTTRAARVAVVR